MLLDKNTTVKVTNRDSGSVGYTVQDLNVTRRYEKGETKEVTADEVRKLSYQPGGRWLLENCLIIHSPELVEEVLGEVEPEYYYTLEDVKTLLSKGSLAQLQDCLDFAPEGVKEMVKAQSVEMKINDLSKREAIKEATGFNVTTAIDINKETEDIDETPAASKRRAAPVNSDEKAETPTGRRTEPVKTSKYKVVTK